MCPKRAKKVLPLVEGEGRRKSGTVMGVEVYKDVLALCIVSGENILEESVKKNDEKGVKKVIGLAGSSPLRAWLWSQLVSIT